MYETHKVVLEQRHLFLDIRIALIIDARFRLEQIKIASMLASQRNSSTEIYSAERVDCSVYA